MKNRYKYEHKPIEELFLATEINLLTHTNRIKKQSLFRGVEWTLSTGYNILNDISINADLSVFVKNTGKINTQIELKGIMSF